MTLYRQLIFAITFMIVCLMAGNMFVSVIKARGYLYEQLQVHAQDTATSLGLTMSHSAADKDQAQIRLFVDVVFDRGYYRNITYRSHDGSIVVDKALPIEVEGVPQWFVKVVDLPEPSGVSEVVSGWMRLGEITVVSHPGFAYRDLWRIFCEQLWLFFFTAVLSYGLVGMGLRLMLRPLRKVEDQAEAICRREFPIQEPLPKTPELRRMVTAMNRMVKKIQAMFQEQVELSESLHRQACIDSVTELGNRRDFDSRLASFMKSEHKRGSAVLLLLQIQGLAELNVNAGRKSGDLCLKHVAEVMRRTLGHGEGVILARRSGADLCAFLPWLDIEESSELINTLFQQLQGLAWFKNEEELQIHIGAVYEDALSQDSSMLERADLALRQAQHKGQPGVFWYRDLGTSARSAEEWKHLLRTAIDEKLFSFYMQPVFQRDGTTIEQLEVLCRLRDGDALLNAGVFLPMAERFAMSVEVDQLMLELLAEKYGHLTGPHLCVNISIRSMLDPSFSAWLQLFLAARPLFAQRLILELPEHGLAVSEPRVREFGRLLESVGANMSLDHFGIASKAFSYLQSLPLFALKVDRSFVHNIQSNKDNQFFVKSLLQIAHSCDVRLFAEGVEEDSEWQTLLDLGIDGAQGYLLGMPAEPQSF